jgi:methyl-accepting chemotaxis protein
MFKDMKIKTKLLISIIPILLGLVGVVTFLTTKSGKVITEGIEKEAQQAAYRHGNSVLKELNTAMNAARTIAHEFETMKDNGRLNRELAGAILKGVLQKNPKLLGTYTCWEPNALDGKDDVFAGSKGHDQTGRYIPYYNRGSGKIVLEALAGYTSSDYYQKPKRTKEETIINPFEYKVAGKEVLLTSLVVPIIVDGSFLGIAGVDIALDEINNTVSKIKPYETGYAILCANNGLLVSNPDKNRIGKIINKSDKDIDQEDILNNISNGQPFSLSEKAEANDSNMYLSFAPIKIGETTTPWSFGYAVPMNKLMQPVKMMKRSSFLIGLLILGLSIFVVIWLSRSINNGISGIMQKADEIEEAIVNGKLDYRADHKGVDIDFRGIVNNINNIINVFVKPINVTAEYIDRIGKGDIPEKIEEDYKGDFKEIKNNFNLCIDSINGLILEANNLTEDAIEGNLDTRGNADNFQGDYKKIIQGINDTLDGIIDPLNVAAEYINRIGLGEIPEKIEEDYKGDFKEIKNNINSAIDGLQGLVNSNNVLQKVAVNDYTNTVEGNYKGIYAEVSEATNTVIDRLKHIQAIAGRVAKGDLSDLADLKKSGKRSEKDEMVPAFIKMEESIQNIVNETKTLTDAASNGKLDIRGNEDNFAGEYNTIIKGINNTLDALIEPIQESAKVMSEIANKNMTARVDGDYAGQLADFKEDINNAAKNLENAMQQVKEAVEQVSSASDQVASGSQQLAEGSNEQASSLEEVSSTLEEMSSMVQQTSDNANQANKLSDEASDAAKEGTNGMEQMQRAIQDIKESSDETSKIVKTIDDIAFQTNLLALNAAVEAARAGEAGQGFAVVAEEVRNLAQRSAEAAKNTSDMIQESIENAENGVEITEQMAEKIDGILDGVNKVNDLVGEIDAATKEQAEGIDQVNTAVAEMNDVTQQNASNSEESASAAEELNSQAEELSGMVATFKLSQNGNYQKSIGNQKNNKKISSNSYNSGDNNHGGNGKGDKTDLHIDMNSSNEITPDDVIPLDDDEMDDF